MQKIATKWSPRKLVLAAVALAAFPAGAIALSPLLAELEWRLLLVGVSTAFISVLVVRHALRKSQLGPDGAAGTCLGFSVLGAIFNSPLSLAAVGISTGEPDVLLLIPVGLIFASLFGAFITVPLGLLFGTAYCVLVRLTHRACNHGSAEAREHALRASGAWLSVVGLISLLALTSLSSTTFSHSGTCLSLALSCSALMVVGGSAVLLAQLRLWRRRYWLGRVHRGLIDGWKVMPVSDCRGTALPHLNRLLLVDEPPNSVLFRRTNDVGNGAYRTAEHFEPVAFI